MRFHQVREVIEWAATTHRRLSTQYGELARTAGDERLRMALGYLAERAGTLQRALEQYLEDDSDHRGVLDTWFNDDTRLPHVDVIEGFSQGAPQNTDDLLATALSLHKLLGDMYARRAEATRVESERAMFRSLVANHDAEVRRIVRDFGRLEML